MRLTSRARTCSLPARPSRPASASWPTKAAIVLLSCFVAGIAAASAQCGITQSCPSTTPGIFPTITTICPSNMCLRDTQIREKYERENNCIFPDSSLCGGKKVDADTQCCIKDARTNKSRIRQKQYTSLDKNFDWNAYRQECVEMQQSEAPPDALWKQCVVGQRHSAADNYPVMKVEANGKARSYCIDGCSTPPKALQAAAVVGTFIFADRNNPTGGGEGGIGEASSFLDACSAHDKCYQTCNQNNQADCDDAMLASMNTTCDGIPEDHETTFSGNFGTKTENTRAACRLAANRMHQVLGNFGSTAFGMRRQQYCQCC